MVSNTTEKFTSPITLAAIDSPTPVPTVKPIRKLKWGTYTGWEATALAEFESKVGKEVNYQATFVHWGNESDFPYSLASNLKLQGKTLVIFWEAMDYNVQGPNQPRFSYDSILSGTWDTYLASFAESTRAYGGFVILVPFEEMNGEWYPWSIHQNGNTPEKHKQAYQYIRKFFKSVPNVSFGWVVNHESVPDTEENRFENYYPGNESIDYIGIDGFNFGEPWMEPNEIFQNGINRLEVYNKPIIIFSTASAEDAAKPQWIRNFGKAINNYDSVIGWIWFNEKKERDWRIWSSPEALEAFKEIVKNY